MASKHCCASGFVQTFFGGSSDPRGLKKHSGIKARGGGVHAAGLGTKKQINKQNGHRHHKSSRCFYFCCSGSGKLVLKSH